MKPLFRSAVIAPGIFLLLSSTACESDVKPVGDVLASDSTLALEVFSARPDTSLDFGDTTASYDSASIAVVPPPADPAPAVTQEAAPARAVVPVPREAVTPVKRKTRVSSTARRARRTATATPVRRSTTSARTSAPLAAAPSRAWLVLPAGAQLEFEADQQICSSESGERFGATLSEAVIRANGTVIPDGASASVSTVSNAAGTNPSISIESLTFDGRTYAVSTRVTHADMKKVRTKSNGSSTATRVAGGTAAGAVLGGAIGRDSRSAVIGAAGGMIVGAVAANRSGRTYARCVPDGGRITAELTEPLRIQLSE